MAVLAPGWEADYEGRPAIHPVVCLGRIASHQRLEDGRFNILMAGLRRGRLLRELPPDKLFREAEIEILDDVYDPQASGGAALQRRLVESFRQKMPDVKQLHKQLDEILASEIPLGILTDILAFTLKLELSVKEQLLAETDVAMCAEALLDAMCSGATAVESSFKFRLTSARIEFVSCPWSVVSCQWSMDIEPWSTRSARAIQQTSHWRPPPTTNH